MPSISLSINPKSDKHRRLVTALRDRQRMSRRKIEQLHKKWQEAEEKHLSFLPERDVDTARRAEREGGKPQYTTMVLPYSYAMLMTAHTYWTTVFLSRNPVHQFAGRHGETEQQVQALEAIMDYQIQVGQALVPYYIWLLDVGKYGVGIIGTQWADETSQISEIREEEEKILGIATGRKKKIRKIMRVPGYMGNKLSNIRPYNFFPDPRVPLNRFQDGEFCAVYAELGWNEIKRREAKGFYNNLDRLRAKTRSDQSIDQGSGELDVPDISDEELLDNTTESAKQRKRESNFFGLYDIYIELIPSEWELGQGDVPEKWVFTTDADIALIIGARPLGAIHNKFPFDLIEFEPEGYAFSNRSFIDTLDPIQRTMDWLINIHFYNVRKALNSRLIVDPSRVVMGDVLDPEPGGTIRLRPQAYGTDTRLAVSQLQFDDVTRANLSDISVMHDFGQRTSGVNDQLMGLLQRGGRRSATEARTDATFGINRQKTLTEYFSAMGWAPHAQKLVQNTQQYFDQERKFRIVGDLAVEGKGLFVPVSPEALQGFYDFIPVDGTLPIDRFAQANLWRDLFSQIAKIPQVAGSYDLGRIFAWVAQLAGLKNINRFRIDVQPDGVVQQQAQAGNIVPLPTAGSPETPPVPSQISGLGGAG